MSNKESALPDAAAQLEKLIRGFQISRMIRLTADLGLADRIPADGYRPVVDLAAECGVVPDAVLRICRALASFGIFEVIGNQIGHSNLSRCLRTDAKPSLHLSARFWTAPGSWGAWEELDKGLVPGEPPHEARWGMSRFEYMSKHPDEGRIYDARMAGSSGDRQQAIAEAYDFSHISHLIDVGGGNGELLRAILTRHLQVRGTVYDRSHVVSLIPPDALMDGRLNVLSGDFFVEIPIGADAYLLSWILHDWSDDLCIKILGNCRKVASHGARLLIADRILEPDPARGNPLDYLSDIQMMVLGGRERTVPEFEKLLSATGFSLSSVTPTASIVSVIEALPT